MTVDRQGQARWFADEWAARLGAVMQSLAGEVPNVSCTAPEAPSFAEQCAAIDRQHGAVLWWQYTFPLPGDPIIWIGAPHSAWARLAGRVLGAAELDDDTQLRETYIEILQQSLGELSRAAASRWNRTVEGSGREAAAAPDTVGYFLAHAAYPDGPVPPIIVAVTGSPQEPPDSADPPAGRDLASGSCPARDSPSVPNSKTFDLLMDVELPVSVSFGHVQLPLQDVLKLTAGSIIELNRTVDEPVEVIVNNCVVARGEVVVVEGNYGVRIQQIMTRRERLEALP